MNLALTQTLSLPKILSILNSRIYDTKLSVFDESLNNE